MLTWLQQNWAYLMAFVVCVLLLWPVLQNLRNHDQSRHYTAIRKFGFLWVVSSLPILLSLLLSDAPVVDGRFSPNGFFNTLYSHFPLDAQFVYAASFLAPVLYIAYDIIREASSDGLSRYNRQEVRKLMKGYSGVTIWAVVILLLTAIAFTQVEDQDANNLMNFSLGSAPIIFYLLSLLLWYCSILKDVDLDPHSPEDVAKEEEEKKSGFEAHMKAKQQQGAG